MGSEQQVCFITVKKLKALLDELEDTDLVNSNQVSAGHLGIMNADKVFVGIIDFRGEEIVRYAHTPQRDDGLEITMRCRGFEK